MQKVDFKLNKNIVSKFNYKEKVSWSFKSLGSGSLGKMGDSESFPRIGDLTYSYPLNQCVTAASH